MVVPSHGRGLLRVGGTNKGGKGRTPDEFRAAMREMAERGEDGLRAIVSAGDQHPLFMAAVKHMTDHGYGKAIDQGHEKQLLEARDTIRRIVAAFHSAITEQCSLEVSESIRAKVENIMRQPTPIDG